MATTYDQGFFDTIRDGCRRSAEIVAPLVLKHVQPRTVLDIGCGEGHWGHAFEPDAEAIGYDGAYIDEPVIEFRATDLEQPLPGGHADLAICLEVAEHLSPARGPGLVADLCAAAPVLLFSAAVPGQPGNKHVNCRWPSYWVALFARHGFAVSDALRWAVWDDERVEPWYRQNLLMAASQPLVDDRLRPWFDPPLPVRDVIHPTIWGWLR